MPIDLATITLFCSTCENCPCKTPLPQQTPCGTRGEKTLVTKGNFHLVREEEKDTAG